ncbi:MAG: preprotein translocase subunit YajC [Prevotella sp.]|nr:preprotein translocase subunit YajC [Bacteroides sp.]MCM1365678.1 preprotein translocase subunit YajC [Prevotella sp.]
MLNTILLQAQQENGGSGLSGIIMIVAMIVIFYFFMIRPQSKKQKEIKKAREAMSNGDKVVTAGGIHGIIKNMSETTMLLEIDKGVTIKVDKASVYPFEPEQPKKK